MVETQEGRRSACGPFHSRPLKMLRVGEDGRPIKPHLKTLNVNLVGTMYSTSSSSPWCLLSLEPPMFVPATATQLALHYLPKTWNPVEPLKCIVFLGCLGASDLPVAKRAGIVRLIVMSPEIIMGCAPESRGLRHLSTWVTRLRESGSTSSRV